MDAKEIARFFTIVEKVGPAITRSRMPGLYQLGMYPWYQSNLGFAFHTNSLPKIIRILSGEDESDNATPMRLEAETFMQIYRFEA